MAKRKMSKLLEKDRELLREKLIKFGQSSSAIESILKEESNTFMILDNYFNTENANMLPSLLESIPTIEVIEIKYHTSKKKLKSLAKVLATNTTIACFIAEGCDIGGAGAQVISEMLLKNRTITHVNLGSNNIKEYGSKTLINMLIKNTSIKYINFGKSLIIDSEGLETLKKMLKVNVVLTHLNLDYVYLGDKGAKALAEGLKENTSLERIYICSQDITFSGWNDILQALKVNKYITDIYRSGYSVFDYGGIKRIQAQLEYNKNLAKEMDKLAKIIVGEPPPDTQDTVGSTIKLYKKTGNLRFYAKEGDEILLQKALEKTGCENIKELIKSLDSYIVEKFLLVYGICKSGSAKLPSGENHTLSTLELIPFELKGFIGSFLGGDVDLLGSESSE